MLRVKLKHLNERNTSTLHSHKRTVACYERIVGLRHGLKPNSFTV